MSRRPRGYELLEHTADTGLYVWAPTLEELLAESAIAVIAVMGKPHSPQGRCERVELEAEDLDALLVDWLSEVLFLFEARDLVPVTVAAKVSEDPCRVEATIEGVSAEGFEQGGPGVKAVTYHGLEIGREGEGYQARVYLDV